MISARTRVCAVIGDPVEHSLSPQLHNAAFRASAVDLVYVAFRVRPNDLAAAIAGVRALGLRGLSVTIPHKVAILPLLDKVDPSATHIGSVNTVVNRGGELAGYSTDGPGALRALRAAGVAAEGKKILLLGSGGAARAVAFALAALTPQPELVVLGIEADEVERLVGDLRERTGVQVSGKRLEPDILREAVTGSDILIHATPVGMAPRIRESVVPVELLQPGQVVFDLVYVPFETELLRAAKAAGAIAVPGLGMFVHQAAIQFELWTGQPAPLQVMEDTVKEILTGVQE
ncbi:MAG TPA: shikimate dehydrogenase [Acidobacteriota bacterium]|nr:shikimate dehydrogenase [Acidobacteriota bacterium]HRV08822.1 shikimate dehydrogenase [Acidobacteriota bacterium]